MKKKSIAILLLSYTIAILLLAILPLGINLFACVVVAIVGTAGAVALW